MRKFYMLVYIVMLFVAIAYFVLGIVTLVTKANVVILGINSGTIYILAGIIALGSLLIMYTGIKKGKVSCTRTLFK